MVNTTKKSTAIYRSQGKLHPREKEILSMWAQGLRVEVIAQRLNIQASTTSMSLSRAFAKLQPPEQDWSREQCITYAIEQKIISLGNTHDA